MNSRNFTIEQNHCHLLQFSTSYMYSITINDLTPILQLKLNFCIDSCHSEFTLKVAVNP